MWHRCLSQTVASRPITELRKIELAQLTRAEVTAFDEVTQLRVLSDSVCCRKELGFLVIITGTTLKEHDYAT